jgi:hypothetical protein
VNNTQNCLISGLYPSFGILETIIYNVSETGSVSVLRRGEGETSTLLGPLERASLSHWMLALPVRLSRICVSHPHLRKETDPVSETLCFLVSRMPDDRQSPKPSNFGQISCPCRESK